MHTAHGSLNDGGQDEKTVVETNFCIHFPMSSIVNTSGGRPILNFYNNSLYTMFVVLVFRKEDIAVFSPSYVREGHG